MDRDPDLEFVSTNRLVREIQRRTDDMVIVASCNRTSDEDALLFGATGSLHGCLGLIEAGRMMVMNRGPEGATDDDPVD